MERELNYLVLEVRSDRSYEMFLELVESGLPTLCVTSTYPEKLEKIFPPMENVITIWPTQEKNDIGGFDVHDLSGAVMKKITDFLESNESPAVLIDDVEFLILENSEEDVREFIRTVSREVAQADGTLIVPVNPDAVSDAFVRDMSRIFDIIDDRTGKKNQGVVLCPECGADWPSGILMCKLCGYRFPVLKDTPKESVERSEDIPPSHEGSQEAAEKSPASAKQIKPSSWLSQGVSHELAGNSYAAIECFDRAIAENPRDAWAYLNKGVSLQRLNRLDDALRAYDRSIELNPDDSDAWNNRGTVMRALGDMDAAIEAYERALNLNPEDAGIWSNLGITKRAKGDMEGALECYERALELNPGDISIWLNKGALLQSEGRLRAALECYEEILKMDPENEVASEKKRLILVRLGRR